MFNWDSPIPAPNGNWNIVLMVRRLCCKFLTRRHAGLVSIYRIVEPGKLNAIKKLFHERTDLIRWKKRANRDCQTRLKTKNSKGTYLLTGSKAGIFGYLIHVEGVCAKNPILQGF